MPFFSEGENYCGPASLAMVMAHAGVAAGVDRLAGEVFLPGRSGSLQVEMLAAPRRHALIGVQIEASLEGILRELAAGSPVLFLVDYGVGSTPVWHYMVATGYDLDRGDLVVHSVPRASERIRFARVEYLWQRAGRWAMVAVPPERVPASIGVVRHAAAVAAFERSARPGAAAAAWEAHVARWPQSTLGWFALGNLAYRAGSLPEAERAYRAAESIDPAFVPALNNLALAVADQGRLGEALLLAERAVAAGGAHATQASETLASLRALANKDTATTAQP